MPALLIRDDVEPVELRRLAKVERDTRVARRLLAIPGAGDQRGLAARWAGMGDALAASAGRRRIGVDDPGGDGAGSARPYRAGYGGRTGDRDGLCAAATRRIGAPSGTP